MHTYNVMHLIHLFVEQLRQSANFKLVADTAAKQQTRLDEIPEQHLFGFRTLSNRTRKNVNLVVEPTRIRLRLELLTGATRL